MLRSLNSGISGMQQFQQRMDIIGNNIANVNTTAYKAARAEFADTFSVTLSGGAPAGTADSGSAALQVGSGVTTAATRNLYTQGAAQHTGVQSDLFINGQGFFVVRDPLNGSDFATRAGNFHEDASGYLVTNNGYRVQGFSDGGATRGDIRIDGTGRPGSADPNATVKSWSIEEEGKIYVTLSDNTRYLRGQILLQNFQDPNALIKEGDNLYSGIGGAGPLGSGSTPEAQAPGSGGLGVIQSGKLELSNVDLANEFAGLITSQRGFQASARLITTSDEMLQEAVNLKR